MDGGAGEAGGEECRGGFPDAGAGERPAASRGTAQCPTQAHESSVQGAVVLAREPFAATPAPAGDGSTTFGADDEREPRGALGARGIARSSGGAAAPDARALGTAPARLPDPRAHQVAAVRGANARDRDGAGPAAHGRSDADGAAGSGAAPVHRNGSRCLPPLDRAHAGGVRAAPRRDAGDRVEGGEQPACGPRAVAEARDVAARAE